MMAEKSSSAGFRHDEDNDWSIPQQSPEIESLFQEAKKHYEAKKYDVALGLYGVILDEANRETDDSPASVYGFIKSLYMISRCHMEKENYEQAIGAIDLVCDLILSNCPDKIHIPEQLIIEIEERRGNIIGAFILALIFKELHPAIKQCKEHLSYIQEKVEDSFAESCSNMSKALSVLTERGKEFYKKDEYSTAAAFFEKVIEIFHFFPDENLQTAYIWRAKCLLKMGKFDEAEGVVIKVLVRFPSLSKARKLHQKIKEAKSARSEKQNTSHHLPEKKERNEDASRSAAGAASTHCNGVKKCTGSPVVSKQESERSTRKTQAPPQSKSNKHNASLKSTERNTALDSFGYEASAAPLRDSPSSTTSKQTDNVEKGSENTMGSGNKNTSNDDDEIASSDEAPFQIVKSRKKPVNKTVKTKTLSLPEGVEIICEHFEKGVFAHPKKSIQISKVCESCERSSSRLKYAFWSKEFKEWRKVRSIPSKVRGKDTQIRSCFHFRSGNACIVKECTFAHGPELQMWDLERRGDLPSPEKYLKNKQISKEDSKTTTLPERKIAPPVDVMLGGQEKCTQEHYFGTTIPSRQKWTPADITATANQTPWVQQSVSGTSDSNTCYLPAEVKIVCEHFMREYKSMRIGVDRKINVCKKYCRKNCLDGRPFAKYAFWSEGFKCWFTVRPYPENINRVAFKPCKDFELNKRCFKNPCTFAHGPELTMWTMEREGTLVPAWRAFSLNIVDYQHSCNVRPLPIGTLQRDLKLCKSVTLRIVCRFGRGCRFPHTKIELEAWKKSYDKKLRELKEAKKRDDKDSLKHYELEFADSIPGVVLSSNPEDPNVQLAEDCDNHTYTWKFCARFEVKIGLPAVKLQNHRHNFHFTKMEVVGFDNNNKAIKMLSEELNACHIPREELVFDFKMKVIEFRVTVSFQASVFGSFTQRILFEFVGQPLLKKEFNIDVGSKETLDKLTDVRRLAVNLETRPWDDKDMEVIRCDPNPEKDKLMSTYSLPKNVERIVSAQLVEGEIRQDTYKQTMHQLLFTEELHMNELLSSLTPKTVKLHAMKHIDLGVDGMLAAVDGQLLGLIELDCNEITPDDMAGRVCLRNVQTIWVQSRDKSNCRYELPSITENGKKKNLIYSGNKIVVTLTPKICKDLKINDKSIVDVEMRFNLNRGILCLMHKAVDSLGYTQARQLFPVEQPIIRRKMIMSWEWFVDPRLNDCQKRVIQAIAEVVPPSPPLVVFGPFGTGKTFTLNQALIYLMREKTNRVLLCTHTNSAADIHVEMLDGYLNGNTKIMHAAKPLRIYALETPVDRTSSIARKYALIEDGAFLMPTRRNVIDHRVVITTLVSADLLTKLNVHHGFFTHIFIDEAAQTWETESLIPLALAGPNTKIVFTGDHMQMSPEVYSPFAVQWGLQKSLPERLFDDYQSKDEIFRNEQVLFLYENYRVNAEILQFASDNCYGGEIVANGNVPAHPELPPLIFYSSKGKDEKQSDNSYLNSSEVYEVVKRVGELIKKWPHCWGRENQEEIAVVAPYKYQIDAIRGELRRKRMGAVKVETIHNVQGREYRALFISTVRTWKSIEDSPNQSGEELSLEFLSDPKLLITAVTRAKSLVAVVGDPFALCTLGRCAYLWNDYISRCYYLNGLNGTTWEELSGDIEAHFSQLNPEAPSFVPKSQTQENDTEEEQHLDVENATESENHESKESSSIRIRNNGTLVKEEQQEDNGDQASSYSGDFQDGSIADDDHYGCAEDDLEDEAVLNMDIDRIIEELCKFIKNRQNLQQNAFPDEEFPALTKFPSKVKETPKWPSVRPNRSLNFESLHGNYQIRIRYGRTEIQLLDIYDRPSERVQQIFMTNYRQQNFEPEVLMHMLENDPSRFHAGQLHIRNERSRTAYLVIPDKEKPDIEVKGSVRHAFDLDTVVVEAQQSQDQLEENRGFGILVGVLNHIMSPRERQYVCKVDLRNPSLMKPINKSVTRIVNLSDKMIKDTIPIYKKRKTLEERAGRPIKIMTMTTNEVIEKKCLFVVEFLQWRNDCSLPLGIAVRTISMGDTMEHCKQILFAECGIRKSFSKSIKEKIQQSFPPTLKIPASELKHRRRRINDAFTIDPPESRDLDDAISIEMTPNGNVKVGIHIADVSFHVSRGSELDREARQRGVSYYPDVEEEDNIPMFPTELSEDLFSLLPQKDRLTVSVFVTLNGEGEVISNVEILRTVTRSCCRLNYSQAQEIIDAENKRSGEVDIPDCVCQAILLIHPLIRKMRSSRLREASLDHSSNRENTDAHELIEELMILANHTVGDFLASRNAGVAPFRTQLEPKVHRLNEWATDYGSLAKCFPALLPHLRSEDITAESKQKIDKEEEEIEIRKQFWDQIRKAADTGNHREVERLICDPLCSPQLAVVRLQLMRIQTKSQYNCSESDTKHHSLGLSNYVHFTSPIRRYIDIEVHRLLLTLIPGNGPKESKKLDQDEMGTLCRRATYFKNTSDKFSKEFKRIHFASSLKQKNQVGVFFIDNLENRFFTIHPVSPDQDLFLGKHKMIKFDDLSPSYCKSDSHNGKSETTLKWRLRIYIGHSSKSDTQDSPNQDSTDECSASTRLEDANKLKKVIVGGSSRADHRVHKIERKTWLRMIDALKESRQDELLRQVKDTEKKLKVKEISVEKDPVRSRSRDVYKHPNFGRLDDTVDSNSDGHFHEVTMKLKQFEMVDIQISSHLYRGMLCPNVQLLRVSSGLCICLEHRRYPCRCFAFDTQQHASKVKYESIDEYIRFWSPVLAMEAASAAVAQSDGFILKSLPVKWSQKDGTTEGKFTLTHLYCESRQIEFNYGDLACVKIPISENLEPEASIANKETRMWIGHCIVQMPEVKDLDGQSKIRISVTVKIHQMASEFPQELLNTSKRDCEMEIIYQPLPLRRMITALNCNLENSSDLVQAICLGLSPSKETFPCPGEQLSLVDHYKTSPFHPLNKYQEQAVQQALTRPFSLIQGPPGTGKTVTGVHIAYWFAKQNQKLKSTMKPENKVKNSGHPSEDMAPPQVLYCGPSNKSVDVVTEYLLRIPGMKDKILRVHGTLIEESEFPIPNKIRLSKPNVSEEELKIPGEKVKEVSLHHYIRSSSSPYSGKLKEMEKEFQDAKKCRERPSDEDVAKYCEIIKEAEEWAIKRSGKEIILCTCSRAGSNTITSFCNNIQQCIIDESGMCMEPEVLVPLTSSRAKQFVLIGDHKQLQPIVNDKRAKRLGLEVSMFERLAKQAFMLKIQYRMHPSICEFPSRQFYNDELETPHNVKFRKTANVKIWPVEGRTVVFCHVEGVEESTVISTAESGVESKYNEKEARKVAQVAKYLVNKYGINKKDVVILTPYREQHKVIKKELKAAYGDIHVTTIIKSQGSEWDYVILSLVRSLPEVDFEPEPSSSWLAEHLGFIADDHQINVALTRAKHGLCIIGNKNLLSYNPTWSSLIECYDETNCVVSDPWPFEYDEYQQN